MHADGWEVNGTTSIALIEPSVNRISGGGADVTVAICLDITAVTVVDAHRQSVVDDDRPDVQSMTVTLTPATSSPTRLLISNIDGRDGEPLCEA
jgi:hypothetical protein